MLLFTDRGPRSIDERDVIAVYCGDTLGGYCSATLVLASGEEISGRVLTPAVQRIESEIATICFRQKQHEHGVRRASESLPRRGCVPCRSLALRRVASSICSGSFAV
jgi:hypothetical protein